MTTAGNASGRNDGAAALLLMSGERAAELGVKPLVTIIGAAAAGVDPKYMGTGPIDATRKLMARMEKENGLTLDDFGLVEINEAFAAQSLACVKELELNPDIVNVNGGAIALGHPLGCSGARISITLIYEMLRRNTKYGLASICVAGGLGMAMAFEKNKRGVNSMNKLGVAGSGNMGNGIGQTAAQNGYDVILYDVSDAQLKRAKESIANALRKRVEKGKMEQDVMDKTLEAIRYTTNITDLADRDVIVEAVVEKWR